MSTRVAMPLDPHQSLVRIVAQSRDAERVLEQLGVDYWFGGDASLERACERAGVPLSVVAERLLHLTPPSAREPFTAANLIAEIDRHYGRVLTPAMRGVEERVRRVRSQYRHSQLGQIAQLVHCIDRQLSDHLALGRTLLFPYFVELEKSVQTATPAQPMKLSACWRGRMALDHTELLGDLLEARRLLSSVLPEPAPPPSVRRAAEAMRQVEEALHHHVLLEYQCLFPLSIRLEQQSAREGHHEGRPSGCASLASASTLPSGSAK